MRERALSLSPHSFELLCQSDTFYHVPSGRLKLREFKDGRAEFISYMRADRPGPKHCSYVIFQCPNAQSLHEVLLRSLGVRGTVRKSREVIHIGQTRVHLDEVDGLGKFLELEVVLEPEQSVEDGETIASQLMSEFEINSDSLIEGAYIDLLEGNAREAQRGHAGVLQR